MNIDNRAKDNVLKYVGDIRSIGYIVAAFFAAYLWMMAEFASAASVVQMQKDAEFKELQQVQEQILYIEDMIADNEAKKADKKKLLRLKTTEKNLQLKISTKTGEK